MEEAQTYVDVNVSPREEEDSLDPAHFLSGSDCRPTSHVRSKGGPEVDVSSVAVVRLQ